MTAHGYVLGIDVGSSSVKASLVDVQTGQVKGAGQSPAEEMPMLAVQPGWAEQAPELWWEHVIKSVRSALQKASANATEVKAIGISYQMHGLVVVDKQYQPLRQSIIWCDSRAVAIGDRAAKKLGQNFCLEHYLNSPGNFTASKLRWVKENEPSLYRQIHKAMLPGDFIALKMTGECVTTDTGMSEGIFWDYKNQALSSDLLREYEIDESILPARVPVFAAQGKLTKDAAQQLGLATGTIVSYRAGDQPNNAFSLNVLHPGETAATAGTSGVIYSVTDRDAYDKDSRVNTFIHVTNQNNAKRNGVLLCVNGTGILNSWLKKMMSGDSYEEMNTLAAKVPIGSEGVSILPFGNGAERILKNRQINASVHGLNFNRHSQAHLFRAAQEAIVFALRYGFEILNEMGVTSQVVRAGRANMFLSPLFREAFVNTMGVKLELYDTDGAKGAALGAGVGAGIYGSFAEAFKGLAKIGEEFTNPEIQGSYQNAYKDWKMNLMSHIG